MIKNPSKNQLIMAVIIFLTFFIRTINISFPSFTADEARIAYRGYTLATQGKDELGRTFPILFNSLSDYQLPLVSYLAAFGELFFGKSDFGARIPFIILGTLLVMFIYQITKLLFSSVPISFLVALMSAFSPPLIFLSRVPNEIIVLCFILMAAFYFAVSKKLNLVLIIILAILAGLTSKFAWFIFPPFVSISLLFYQQNIKSRKKILFISTCIIISLFAFFLFKNIPQGGRSLSENNFPIFTDITIGNGINYLRGQGIELGWPPIISKLLFNKDLYILTGVIHWFSHLQPAFYFGQLDGTGQINFPKMAAFGEILIIPFLFGFFSVLKLSARKYLSLLIFLPLLTFPAVFIYPGYSLGLVVLTIPFLCPVIAVGLSRFPTSIKSVFVVLMILEVVMQFAYPVPFTKVTNSLRPTWIKPIMLYAAEASKDQKVIISDDITGDNVSFLEWYTNFDPKTGFSAEQFPYKLRQSAVGNISMHGFDKNANLCNKKDKSLVLVSKRDIILIEDRVDLMGMSSYRDSLNQEVAFSLTSKLCVN